METITEIWSKGKRFLLGEAFVPILIILVGFASFGLGRLSVTGDAAPPVRILGTESKYPEEGQAAGAGQSLASGAVVGSRNSDKYHFPWCSGAQRISEANKVTFASAAEARAAGYTPAANCEGLE